VQLRLNDILDASLMLCGMSRHAIAKRRLVTMFALNQPSWRDKFDENGKSRDDPWWSAPDDPTADAAWLSKYNF
jgi:hypothetical protein